MANYVSPISVLSFFIRTGTDLCSAERSEREYKKVIVISITYFYLVTDVLKDSKNMENILHKKKHQRGLREIKQNMF